MAILLYKLTGFSISSMVIAINIPLLIFGIKYLGKTFAVKTVLTIVLMSIFIDFIKLFEIPTITSNILLASIFGGIIIGFGVGFIIKANSSAGGSTVIAKVVSSKTQIKPSQVILIVDTIIVLASIYIFKDFEKALWSIISIYATIKAIDLVLTGTLTIKVVHIATNKPEVLSLEISKQLGEQGTIINGSSLIKQKEKTIIFLVLDVKKLSILRELINDNDEEALMIIMEASEMQGRGY